MNANWVNWIITIYFAGLITFLIQAVKMYMDFQDLKEHCDFDMLESKSVRFYLVAKPFLWPYYFCLHHNPLEYFSEFFFKHYGDEGEVYLGTQGLNNYLNDLFRGKNRYHGAQAEILCWLMDKNEQEYRDCVETFPDEDFSDDTRPAYAKITYMPFKGKYLLGVTWIDDKLPDGKKEGSRFQLDQCERLCASQFKTRLYQINPARAEELLSQLNLA